MCEAACSAGPHHAAECLLLSDLRARLEPEVWAEQLDNIQQCLLTIRLLTLQWRSVSLRLGHLDVEDCSEELLRQLSYAIKNQLGHLKPPNRGFGTQNTLIGGI